MGRLGRQMDRWMWMVEWMDGGGRYGLDGCRVVDRWMVGWMDRWMVQGGREGGWADVKWTFRGAHDMSLKMEFSKS